MTPLGLTLFMSWTGMDDRSIANTVYASFPSQGQFERIAQNLSEHIEEAKEKAHSQGFVEGVQSVCETFTELDIDLANGSEDAQQGFATAVHFFDEFLFKSVVAANAVCSE